MSRKKPTLEEYKEVGALLRLYKELGAKTVVAVGQVMTIHKTGRLNNVVDKITKVCSDVESEMYVNYPELEKEKEYAHVFEGSTRVPARDSIDKEMLERMRKIVDELFEN